MTASAEELRALFQGPAPKLTGPRAPLSDTSLDVGLNAERWDLDSQGRVTHVERIIYRLETQDAVTDNQVLSATWRPWYQSRPEIHIRVLHEDGTFAELDPAGITEHPVARDGDIYTDARRLRAPLPALRVGDIVEEQIVTAEHRAAFASGRSARTLIRYVEPYRWWRREVTVPAGTKLVWDVAGGGVPALKLRRSAYRAKRPRGPQTEAKPKRRGTERRVRFLWERRDDPGLGVFEPMSPRDDYALPFLRWSTSPGWAAAAREFDAIVEGRLADAKLDALANEIAGDAKEPHEIARRIMAWVGAKLRYTGLEFGDAAYVPAKPAQVLAQRHGDCKDLATLVTGLLRARGVDAHVALLGTSYAPRLSDSLAGLGFFNHAIVAVRLPGQAPEGAATRGQTLTAPAPADRWLWLDATAPSFAVGVVPEGDRGTRALIAAPDTTELVDTPPRRRAPTAQGDVPPADRYEERRRVTLGVDGQTRVVEVTKAYGSHAAWLRQQQRESPRTLRENLTRWARREYGAEGDVEVRVDASEGRDPVTVEVTSSRCTALDAGGKPLELKNWNVFNSVPRLLKVAPTPDNPLSPKDRASWLERTRAVDFPLQDARSVCWEVTPPEGFQLRVGKLANQGFQAGPAVFRAAKRELPGGGAEVCYTFDLGRGPLSPANIRDLRRHLLAYNAEPFDTMELAYEPVTLWDQGLRERALKRWRALAQAHPREEAYRLRWVEGLATLGLRDAAVWEAQRLVADFPESARAKNALGWALAHGAAGGPLYGKGMRRAEAIEALRAAGEAGSVPAWLHLAEIYRRGEDGEVHGPGADFNRALAAREAARRLDPKRKRTLRDAELLTDLMRYDEAKTLVQRLDPNPARDALLIRLDAVTPPAQGAKTGGLETAMLHALQIADGDVARFSSLAFPAWTEVVRARGAAAFVDALRRASEGAFPGYKEMVKTFDPAQAERALTASPTSPCAMARAFAAAVDRAPGMIPKWLLPRHREELDLLQSVHGYRMTNVAKTNHVDTWAARTFLGTPLSYPMCEARPASDAHPDVVELTLRDAFGTRTWQAVHEGGWWWFVAPSMQGRALEAYRAFQRGDRELGMWWWRRIPPHGEIPPSLMQLLSGWGDPKTATLEELKVAAGLIVAQRWSTLDDTLPHDIEALGRHTPGPSPTSKPQGAPSSALRGHAWDSLAAAFEQRRAWDRLGRLAGRAPTDSHVDWGVAMFEAVAGLGDVDAMCEQAAALERKAKTGGPESLRVVALTAQAGCAEARGELAEAQRLYEAAAHTGTGDGTWANNGAWHALFTGRHLRKSLRWLESDELAPAARHTRAALRARLGKNAAAMDDVRKLVKDGTYGDVVYVVLGRIAANLGLPEVARAYYDQGKPDDKPNSAYALSRKWRAELDAETRAQAARTHKGCTE